MKSVLLDGEFEEDICMIVLSRCENNLIVGKICILKKKNIVW